MQQSLQSSTVTIAQASSTYSWQLWQLSMANCCPRTLLAGGAITRRCLRLLLPHACIQAPAGRCEVAHMAAACVDAQPCMAAVPHKHIQLQDHAGGQGKPQMRWSSPRQLYARLSRQSHKLKVSGIQLALARGGALDQIADGGAGHGWVRCRAGAWLWTRVASAACRAHAPTADAICGAAPAAPAVSGQWLSHRTGEPFAAVASSAAESTRARCPWLHGCAGRAQSRPTVKTADHTQRKAGEPQRVCCMR